MRRADVVPCRTVFTDIDNGIFYVGIDLKDPQIKISIAASRQLVIIGESGNGKG